MVSGVTGGFSGYSPLFYMPQFWFLEFGLGVLIPWAFIFINLLAVTLNRKRGVSGIDAFLSFYLVDT
jgi:hypothetical protein